MSAARVIHLPERNKYGISKVIEATEVFELIMLNLLDPDCEKIVIKYINNDERELSELSIWLLKRRGFCEKTIPKMLIPEEIVMNKICYA